MGAGVEETTTKALSMSDSIFAVLLVGALLVCWKIIQYVLRKNDEREKRYMDVIDKQAEALQNVKEMRDDVHEIKQHLFNKGGMDNAKRD